MDAGERAGDGGAEGAEEEGGGEVCEGDQGAFSSHAAECDGLLICVGLA